MPTTKDLEAALRAAGWSPAAVQPFVHVRIWTHPELQIDIKVPRTPFISMSLARFITRGVRRPVGR